MDLMLEVEDTDVRICPLCHVFALRALTSDVIGASSIRRTDTNVNVSPIIFVVPPWCVIMNHLLQNITTGILPAAGTLSNNILSVGLSFELICLQECLCHVPPEASCLLQNPVPSTAFVLE